MSFTVFPRSTRYGHSTWTRQVQLNKPAAFAEQQPQQPQQQQQQQPQDKDVDLDERRAMHITLDPTLVQKLQQTQPSQRVHQLKSSLRQTVSAPVSPNSHSPPRSQKSVKFDPLHLEQVCVFDGTHSPSEVLRFQSTQQPSFSVVYSQWPTIRYPFLQQQQDHVRLKRSLRLLDGGMCVRGQVLVRNLGFEKHVNVHYTLDGWQTVKNIDAHYEYGRDALDVFAFEIDLTPSPPSSPLRYAIDAKQPLADHGHVRATLDLAVKYSVLDENNRWVEYWDNNNSRNYQIQIVEDKIEQSKKQIKEPAAQIETDSLQLPPLQPPRTRRSSRYDFSQSFQQAKQEVNIHGTNSAVVAPSKAAAAPKGVSTAAATKSMAIPVPTKAPKPTETKSAPASPVSDYISTQMATASYNDLIAKYCFYGSPSSNLPVAESPSPVSINI
ncbi:putative phosphatase regulatory subunit-domain-containing protein [Gongronella butleri]|nr:putative phosphatase regulatory subunit-domain-containing protein [Gongronella butleri]